MKHTEGDGVEKNCKELILLMSGKQPVFAMDCLIYESLVQLGEAGFFE